MVPGSFQLNCIPIMSDLTLNQLRNERENETRLTDGHPKRCKATYYIDRDLIHTDKQDHQANKTTKQTKKNTAITTTRKYISYIIKGITGITLESAMYPANYTTTTCGKNLKNNSNLIFMYNWPLWLCSHSGDSCWTVRCCDQLRPDHSRSDYSPADSTFPFNLRKAAVKRCCSPMRNCATRNASANRSSCKSMSLRLSRSMAAFCPSVSTRKAFSADIVIRHATSSSGPGHTPL